MYFETERYSLLCRWSRDTFNWPPIECHNQACSYPAPRHLLPLIGAPINPHSMVAALHRAHNRGNCSTKPWQLHCTNGLRGIVLMHGRLNGRTSDKVHSHNCLKLTVAMDWRDAIEGERRIRALYHEKLLILQHCYWQNHVLILRCYLPKLLEAEYQISYWITISSA